MLSRRRNPIVTLIAIPVFLVCFGSSLWVMYACNSYNNGTDQTPILRSASNNNAVAISYRRNAETNSTQLTITIANYFIITAGNENQIFTHLDSKAVQSPWLLCGKVSIPARADPGKLIA